METLIQLAPNILLFAITIGLTLLQTVFMVYFFWGHRAAQRERSDLHREIFGLLKRLEGLTASRRDMVLKHYDRVLENLSNRLPTTIASHAGQLVFETESKVLSKLAELEPGLNDNPESREKLDELIKTMENLEHTIVALTADTVRTVMSEARKGLSDEDVYNDLGLAA